MNDLWFGEECFIETFSAFKFIGHKLTNPLPNAVVVLHRNAKPMVWILLTLLKWVIPMKMGGDGQDLADCGLAFLPRDVLPSWPWVAVSPNSIPLPPIMAHHIFVIPNAIKPNLLVHSEWGRSNPSWVKEVGRSTRPGSGGHLISVSLPITHQKLSTRQDLGTGPNPKTLFKKSTGGSQSYSWHNPFPIAQHSVTAMAEDRRNQTLKFSLSLLTTPVRAQRELLAPLA